VSFSLLIQFDMIDLIMADTKEGKQSVFYITPDEDALRVKYAKKGDRRVRTEEKPRKKKVHRKGLMVLDARMIIKNPEY